MQWTLHQEGKDPNRTIILTLQGRATLAHAAAMHRAIFKAISHEGDIMILCSAHRQTLALQKTLKIKGWEHNSFRQLLVREGVDRRSPCSTIFGSDRCLLTIEPTLRSEPQVYVSTGGTT